MTGFAFVIIEEIEATNFVRTIIGAITSTDTTIVSHRVEALVVVNRGVRRTNRFARCGFAVLTCHTHESHLWVFRNRRTCFITTVKEVTIEANPMHATTLQHLVASHDWNIIFRLTCCDASIATSTGI